jgi:hypothetical protein
MSSPSVAAIVSRVRVVQGLAFNGFRSTAVRCRTPRSLPTSFRDAGLRNGSAAAA